ncbi:hypothetical protein Q7M76_00805 [Candidatus Liberibacter asiaticus]|uniref:Uncharacterized protein n=5 Tax=Liberibacter asiaticus TaxID=34021 RepID=C6XHM1_LIBAP|nr:hypothetical protein [Candidatus Liberibacter asiaticus]ACT56764.1 hypothetical protein CLIBASIA_00880 [Candidatus Liberibacter asiaticus str. psy62]AGH16531.1 hypothetical protein WSI_00795 [Candidatus Liberibacter asiaticus str. gxpsy]ALK06930.1 hypothetical protein CD16_00805 [Candidatus Liberibacter asiaticus]ASK52401.1 hypothetical protein B2I23_00835 [Candidatus Liberibacter asiaticus]AWL13725.1 hypothetical protein DIC79_00845 [Candidatus Liberibacter asiaticus]
MSKTKHLKKTIFLSKKGNITILTAIIIPLIITLITISTTCANILYHRASIEASADEALNHGIVLLCKDSDLTPQDITPPVLKDLETSLIKNDFSIKEAAQIKKESSINYQGKIPLSQGTYLNLHAVYHVPLNSLERILLPHKQNMDIVVDVNKILNCHHKGIAVIADPWYKADTPMFVEAINSLKSSKNIILGILTGDMTQSSTTKELKRFYNIYSLKFPFFRGLGSQEYIGNRPCRDPYTLTPSIYGCAFIAINDISQQINDHYPQIKSIKEFNGDSQRYRNRSWHGETYSISISGSQSYSWNIDNVHFIQANYSMFHSVYFNDEWSNIFTVAVPEHISKQDLPSHVSNGSEISQWIRDDVFQAQREGKYIILFADDIDRFSSIDQKRMFEKFLTQSKISTIFTTRFTSSPESYIKDSTGRPVRVYNINKNSKNEFILLEMTPHYINVTAYERRGKVPHITRKMSPIDLLPKQR